MVGLQYNDLRYTVFTIYNCYVILLFTIS